VAWWGQAQYKTITLSLGYWAIHSLTLAGTCRCAPCIFHWLASQSWTARTSIMTKPGLVSDPFNCSVLIPVISSAPPTKDAAKITMRHARREALKFKCLISISVWKRPLAAGPLRLKDAVQCGPARVVPRRALMCAQRLFISFSGLITLFIVYLSMFQNGPTRASGKRKSRGNRSGTVQRVRYRTGQCEPPSDFEELPKGALNTLRRPILMLGRAMLLLPAAASGAKKPVQRTLFYLVFSKPARIESGRTFLRDSFLLGSGDLHFLCIQHHF